MAWIESHQELREHPKTKRLCRLLGLNRREAVGLLHFLWWWAYDYASEGDLSDFSNEDIADAVDWEGDAGQLVGALIEAGFVDADRQVHDWDEFAEKWIERRRANAERMRQRRASRRNGAGNAHAGDVQDTTIARAPATGPDLNRTGPDRTGPDTTTPLPPPPPAEEGERPKARQRRRDEPVEIPVTPLSATDEQRWDEAMTWMKSYVMPSRFNGIVSKLTPVGRAPNGGLCLRAPPNVAGDARNMLGAVVRALEQVGDAAGKYAEIVE